MADNSLLFRLSSATGPSRELDAEIALESGWKQASLHGNAEGPHYWLSPTGQIYPQPTRYTESIEAVRRDLLGKRPAILKFNNHNGKAEARVGGLPGEGFVIKEGEHEVPAIALVIAIRKAREDSKP